MRKNAGATLLEVLIASVILAAIIGLTMSVLSSTTSLAVKGSVNADVENRGRELLKYALAEFPTAKFTGTITPAATVLTLGIYTNNTEIAYRVPVSRNNAGNVLPDITAYGYKSPLPSPDGGDHEDLACFIRFEADTIIKESSTASSASSPSDSWGTTTGTLSGEVGLPSLPALETQIANYDINRDGDRNDAFVRGRLFKYIVAPAGDALLGTRPNPLGREGLCDNLVLAVSAGSAFDGDMDNDGQSDLLFMFADQNGNAVTNAQLSVTGSDDNQHRSVVITAWFGNWGENRKEFIVRRARETIKLRNEQ